MDRVQTKTNPKMFDKAVLPIQQALADAFSWLDYSLGIVESLTEIREGKKFTSANIYIGEGQYERIEPCHELGNFSFFVLRDPQTFGAKNKMLVKGPFSLIIWYNLTEVSPEYDERNREQIKGQILGLLDSLHLSGFEITKIYEKPEAIFNDFSYVHTDNQFLMHPFTGLRIDGVITAKYDCYE